MVYIGEAGGEYFQRGYMSGYDADTGKQRWKFFVAPGDPSKGPDGAASDSVMPMAAKTWSGEWWKTGGGGPPCGWFMGFIAPDVVVGRRVWEVHQGRYKV